jgi:hypothetical protein
MRAWTGLWDDAECDQSRERLPRQSQGWSPAAPTTPRKPVRINFAFRADARRAHKQCAEIPPIAQALAFA